MNNNTHKDIKINVLLGILFGFLATAFGFYFYTQVFNDFSMKFIERLIRKDDYLGEILAYSVLPNIFAFFVFIKRKEDYKAKGVIIATILVAIAFFVSFFI